MENENKKPIEAVVKEICETKSLTRTMVLEYIGMKLDKTRMFDPDEIVTIEPSYGYANGQLKEKVRTTLGCLIVNKIIFESVFKVLGFVNQVLDNKAWFKIVEKLDNALIVDKITGKEYIEVMDMRESFGNAMNAFFTPTPTIETFTPDPDVLKLRDELVSKYRVELEAGNEIIAADIEKQLLALAKKKLKENNDQGMDLYDSGAKSSFGNNFKSRVFNGPVMNPETGKFDILTSNYYEGTNKKDIPILATAMVSGAYAKGVGTAVGGYMVKQANAAFQTAMFDEIGTDCGTELYIDMLITSSNYAGFMYRYIITDGGLVKLDADNIEQYMGKWVKLRDATCCKADKICSKCSGEYLQLIGITNAGLTTTTLYNSMVNKSMKKFHDTSVKTYVIDNVKDLLIKI